MLDLAQIRSWATEAVQIASDIASASLDFSRSSVGTLESTLDALRKEQRDDSETWDLACRFGAYLGEVMLKDFADLTFSWAEDYDGEPCLMISEERQGNGLDKILPITKCNKYLQSGQSESVAKLYATCLSMLKGGDVATHLSNLGVDPSQVAGVEPAYVVGGKFNANAAAWLLYGDYVFFQQDEILWDGSAHRIVGLQINSAKMGEIPTLVANSNILSGLIDLLTEIEKDDGLHVPLEMVHPGLHGALRNEELTGITLFNLMACAQALIVKETDSDIYAVLCDSRLPAGIPSFYLLVARMIWDMRAYNDREGTFKVGFANARNFDADAVLDAVDEMVPGAFSQAICEMEVNELPQIELPSGEEVQDFATRASRVFASGFDEPMDIQADEELFEATLNQLARECPIVQDIEGTHHMGRIPRIEHVRVGDPLILASDWQSEWFDPVCIEVFNEKGETLGNLRERFSPSLSGHRELACLLPYLTATVETVTPKSKRRGNAKYALMDVRMELDPAVLGDGGRLIPEVVDGAKALLSLPKGERVVTSKCDLAPSQLKGNISVDSMREPPEPLKEVSRLSTGVRKPLEMIGGMLPSGLVDCLKMCSSNVVPADFYIATVDWLERELPADCGAEIAEASALVITDSLRAQSYKGASPDELEIMQIMAMDAVVALNEATEFESYEGLLADIENLDANAPLVGHETEAATTQVVDVLAAAYWDPTIRLVNALIEIVGKKKEQEFEHATDAWSQLVKDSEDELAEAQDAVRRAEASLSRAESVVREREAELKQSKRTDRLREQTETLISEARQAEIDRTQAEFSLTEQKEKRRLKDMEISEKKTELDGLGLFAFSRKKALRAEIEVLDGELKMLDESIASQEARIATLNEKASQIGMLEKRLADYPESKSSEFEESILEAKITVDHSRRDVSRAQTAKSERERELRQCKASKPRAADYSAEAAKRPLRWQPTLAGSPTRALNRKQTSGNRTSPSAEAYLKGNGSTWRDRRPSFTDSNPVHINGYSTSGAFQSGYRATVGYSIDVDEPDMTHRLDVDIAGPSSAFDAANAFLASAASAFRRRDYSGQYGFLKDFSCSSLPFTSIGTRLYVPAMDMAELAAAIGLIGALNTECPQLQIDGIAEMTKSYAGIHNTYLITSDGGNKTLSVEQKVERS